MKSDLTNVLRAAIEGSGWNQGKKFDVIIKDDCILINCSNGKPRYTLEELIASCDPNAPKNADLEAWDAGER